MIKSRLETHMNVLYNTPNGLNAMNTYRIVNICTNGSTFCHINIDLYNDRKHLLSLDFFHHESEYFAIIKEEKDGVTVAVGGVKEFTQEQYCSDAIALDQEIRAIQRSINDTPYNEPSAFIKSFMAMPLATFHRIPIVYHREYTFVNVDEKYIQLQHTKHSGNKKSVDRVRTAMLFQTNKNIPMQRIKP